jgi:hypothetical protein
MPKLGDTSQCGVCGGMSVLRLLQPSVATLGWIESRSIPYDVPALPMWQCQECDDRQPLDGELES